MNCRASTVASFGQFLQTYIVPQLDHLLLSEVERSHASALHRSMRDKPNHANMVLKVLSGMLLLTGCRRNEILTLRRDDVDRCTGELRLRDGKTDLRHVPLTPAVGHMLDPIEQSGGESLGDRGPEARQSSVEPVRCLAADTGTCGSCGCACTRSAPSLYSNSV